MDWSKLNNRKAKIIGSAVLAILIVMLILLIVPIMGIGFPGAISTGDATRGGGWGIHQGSYF